MPKAYGSSNWKVKGAERSERRAQREDGRTVLSLFAVRLPQLTRVDKRDTRGRSGQPRVRQLLLSQLQADLGLRRVDDHDLVEVAGGS
jgi:hypothetical protein